MSCSFKPSHEPGIAKAGGNGKADLHVAQRHQGVERTARRGAGQMLLLSAMYSIKDPPGKEITGYLLETPAERFRPWRSTAS